MFDSELQGGYRHGAASVERILQNLSQKRFLLLLLHPRICWTRSAASVVGTPALSHHVRRNSHDGSESESETIDLNSWTRSGGPLMRTASADKFISFIHNLEIDTGLSRPCTVEGGTAGISLEYLPKRSTTEQ